MLRDCPIDHRCMTAISPDEVFEQARMMLMSPDLATRTERRQELREVRKNQVEVNIG